MHKSEKLPCSDFISCTNNRNSSLFSAVRLSCTVTLYIYAIVLLITMV